MLTAGGRDEGTTTGSEGEPDTEPEPAYEDVWGNAAGNEGGIEGAKDDEGNGCDERPEDCILRACARAAMSRSPPLSREGSRPKSNAPGERGTAKDCCE